MPIGWRTGLALLVLAALATPVASQEPAVPDFPAGAEAITVDVVVLDKDGKPIRGLKASDFSVREDGKPQTIVGFEARDLANVPSHAEETEVGLPRGASEDTTGRTLGFIVDDLGLDPRGVRGIEAIRRWALEQADPRDEVTLATTSGQAEWRGHIGSGRAELLQVLEIIRPRRPPTSFFTPMDARGPSAPITEYMAFRIVSGRVPGATGAQRATAGNVYEWTRDRSRALVGAIGAFARDRAEARGRKPLFVVAQSFIRDEDLRQFDDAIDVAQRSNVAVYFIDPRGLIAGGIAIAVPSASRGSGLTGGDGLSSFDDSMREVVSGTDLGGGEEVARGSGGAVVRDTNDVVGRLAGAVDESSAYYLLGYQPAVSEDGKWHTIDVDVAVKDATVRARRGYFASRKTITERRVADADAKRKPREEKPATPPETPTAAEAAPAAPARDVPVFASQADAITVDVVVVDGDGRAVRDLESGDFTLLEDGRPMRIVGFDARVLEPGGQEAPPPAAETAAATNEDVLAGGGRTHAFLIDDLGIEPTRMPAVAKAITDWLAKGTDPRDQLTIATSSGDAWWSDAAGTGRADFEAVLARVRGKKQAAGTNDALSEVEAYRIDLQGPGDMASGGGATGPPTGGSCAVGSDPSNVRDRVVDRWLRTGACVCDPMNVLAAIRSCRSQVTIRATEVYRGARLRTQAVLGAVERISQGLAGARGRKSVVVFSEGLLRDVQQGAFESAVDASRRGNTAVSFVDVRGLVALSFFGADQATAASPGDIGVITAETTRVATAGGEYLAQTTGGSMVANSNDIAGELARVTDESSTYYLLGYQPDRPPDGKWRRVEVKVTRPGLKVRARRGYFATKAQSADAGKARKDKKRKKDALPTRLLDPALAVGGERDAIPVRIAPYVMEMDDKGTARVVVAIEVATASLTFAGDGRERTAQLDVTVLGVSRDGPRSAPLDSHVSLGLDAKAVGGWWTFSRELRLPPGPAQVRALVRDSASGRSGLVTTRFDVPAASAPYVSSLLLSDRIAPASPGGTPQLMPVARRTFPSTGTLYCAYEVYVAPGREPSAIPLVTGGYTIEDEQGLVVASAPPTPIAIALGAQVSRVHAFPLSQLGPGRYGLTIQADDRASGASLQAHETFTVEPAANAERRQD